MPKAAVTDVESERILALRQSCILDTAPEADFDDLTRFAARVCNTPIALVSLVDTDRQWFKSAFGLPVRETHRDFAFCAHAILGHEPLLITDASSDPRTCDNPLVSGDPHIRFYAGIPLRSSDGYALGTLCVIDTVPRVLSSEQLLDLESLARQATGQIELRRANHLLAAEKKALSDSHDSLTRIAAQVPGVVYQYLLRPDGSSCFPYASEGMRRIYRVSPDEVIEDASKVLKLLHPDDQEEVIASIEESARTQQPWRQEYRVRFENGETRWLSGNATPTRLPDESVCWHGFITDITQQRIERDETYRLQAQQEAIIDASTQVAIIATDLKGGITVFNSGAEQMLGYRAEEIVGVATPEIFHLKSEVIEWGEQISLEIGREVFGFDAFVEYARQGRYDARDWTYVRKDGTHLTARLVVTSIRDADKTPTGFLGVAADVTERINAERELVAAREAAEIANRAKSEFLANMSHEIRTPMNGIIGCTDLALDTSLTKEQREYLETVHASADSLLRIINDILDFSKIEAGKLEIVTHSFNLRDTLGDTMKTLAFLAHEKGLELNCQIPSNVPDFLIGDAGRIRQVLINLIGNAIKFTDRGEVTVLVETESHTESTVCLHVSVQDTGIGIPKDKQAAIFEAFMQADISTTRTYGGTGLGLTISRQLVTMMGGELTVASTEGTGSTFSFTIELPVSSKQQVGTNDLERAQIALAMSPAITTSSLRVLVAEDNKVNQKVAKRVLEKLGHQVQIEKNGLLALKALHSRNFDVVMMDIQMPDLDGFETTTTIRKLEQQTGHHLPIIAMTAHATTGDRELCLAAGMDDYVSKPIRADLLSAALARMVEQFSIRDVEQSSPWSDTHAEDNGLAFDLAATLLKFDGDRDFLVEISEVLLKGLPTQLQTLAAAVAEQDIVAVGKLAHAIEGSLVNFCAEPSYSASQALERECRSGSLDDIATLHQLLVREVARLADALRRELALYA